MATFVIVHGAFGGGWDGARWRHCCAPAATTSLRPR